MTAEFHQRYSQPAITRAIALTADWRIGRPKKKTATVTKKARRQQQATSRRKNR